MGFIRRFYRFVRDLLGLCRACSNSGPGLPGLRARSYKRVHRAYWVKIHTRPLQVPGYSNH